MGRATGGSAWSAECEEGKRGRNGCLLCGDSQRCVIGECLVTRALLLLLCSALAWPLLRTSRLRRRVAGCAQARVIAGWHPMRRVERIDRRSSRHTHRNKQRQAGVRRRRRHRLSRAAGLRELEDTEDDHRSKQRRFKHGHIGLCRVIVTLDTASLAFYSACACCNLERFAAVVARVQACASLFARASFGCWSFSSTGSTVDGLGAGNSGTPRIPQKKH